MDLLKQYKDEQTFAVIGAAMAVHRELGPGFLESAYGDALEIEFTKRNIPFEREKLIHIYYKGEPIKTNYQADFCSSLQYERFANEY